MEARNRDLASSAPPPIAGVPPRPVIEPEVQRMTSIGGPEAPAYGDLPKTQAMVSDWIRENQTLAMIAGFAMGVFVGAMIRD